MRKAFIFFLSALCLAGPLAAQRKAEIREVFFRIDSVTQRNDSFLVRATTYDVQLEKGLLVKSCLRWKPAKDGKPVVNFKEAGFGWVISSEIGEAWCYIDPYQKNVRVAKDDIISVKIEVPVLPYRSIFSELALINIEFRDISRWPLYSLGEIWNEDSRQFEDSLIKTIISDIKETYEFVKDMPEQVALRKPLIGSRFKGKTVLEVMRDVDRDALMGFLLFVKYFPGKYIAQDFKANETFATWVLNNAPYTKPDVYKALFPVYKDKNKLAQLLPEFSYDIKKNGLVASFAEEAVTLYNNQQKNEAANMLDFARTLAYTINDTSGKADYHLNQA
ncbi:MAG: hypothetical protein ACXWB9_11610, partial [Flavisolibacter sp.]